MLRIRRIKMGPRNNNNNKEWNCCFGQLHVHTATILIGLWHLFLNILALSLLAVIWRNPHMMEELENSYDYTVDLNAPALPTPLSKVEPPYAYRDHSLNYRKQYKNFDMGGLVCTCMIAITLMMIYGTIKGKPSHLLPFFCLQLFDFAITTLTAAGYLCYLQAIHRLVADSHRLPWREKLLELSPEELVVVVLGVFIFIVFLKAYAIGIVWRCYKYLTLRQQSMRTLLPCVMPEMNGGGGGGVGVGVGVNGGGGVVGGGCSLGGNCTLGNGGGVNGVRNGGGGGVGVGVGVGVNTGMGIVVTRVGGGGIVNGGVNSGMGVGVGNTNMFAEERAYATLLPNYEEAVAQYMKQAPPPSYQVAMAYYNYEENFEPVNENMLNNLNVGNNNSSTNNHNFGCNGRGNCGLNNTDDVAMLDNNNDIPNNNNTMHVNANTPPMRRNDTPGFFVNNFNIQPQQQLEQLEQQLQQCEQLDEQLEQLEHLVQPEREHEQEEEQEQEQHEETRLTSGGDNDAAANVTAAATTIDINDMREHEQTTRSPSHGSVNESQA